MLVEVSQNTPKTKAEVCSLCGCQLFVDNKSEWCYYTVSNSLLYRQRACKECAGQMAVGEKLEKG